MKSLLAVIATLSLAVPLSAEPLSSLTPAGRVNDFANALDNASFMKLDNACREIDERAHAQVVVTTIKSLDGANIYDYSVALFRQWGIGTAAANRGVLILLAVQDHRYRITVGTGLDSILGEGNVAAFGLEAVPFLRRGEYGSAALVMTSRVGKVLAEDTGVTLPSLELSSVELQTSTQATYAPEPVRRENLSIGSSVAFIFVFLCIALTVAAYFVVQYGRRRQLSGSSEIAEPSRDPSVFYRPYMVPGSSGILGNPTYIGAPWSSSDNSSATPSSLGSVDSGSCGSVDSGGSFGGGDTSGGGAGGSW
jgi:uncharacterized protein